MMEYRLRRKSAGGNGVENPARQIHLQCSEEKKTNAKKQRSLQEETLFCRKALGAHYNFLSSNLPLSEKVSIWLLFCPWISAS